MWQREIARYHRQSTAAQTMVYDENKRTALEELERSTHPELSLINAMFEGTSGSYDSVVKLATLGMDHWWKRRLMRAIPPGREYHRILDLACGTGISTLKIAEKFPQAEIVGIDLTKSYLDVATKKINTKHVQNIKLVQMPAEEMEQLPGEFDLVVGSFVPKLVDLERLGSGCEAKISLGGALVLHDFIVPTKKLLPASLRERGTRSPAAPSRPPPETTTRSTRRQNSGA